MWAFVRKEERPWRFLICSLIASSMAASWAADIFGLLMAAFWAAVIFGRLIPGPSGGMTSSLPCH